MALSKFSKKDNANSGAGDGQGTGNNGTGQVKTGVDGTNGPRYVELMVNPDTMEIYGFAHKGQIYIDKSKMNPNTLIHEYTHLWCKAVQSWNPSTGNANIKYSLVNYLFVIT